MNNFIYNLNLGHAREALELSKLQETTKQQEVCIIAKID